MITIPDTEFKAGDIRLAQILNSTTKVNMLKVLKKFDLYASPNLKKDETARRVAAVALDNPIEILSRLNKTELQIVDEFVKGADDTYVVRKQRQTPYILQSIISSSPIATRPRANGTCSCRRNCVSRWLQTSPFSLIAPRGVSRLRLPRS